MGLLRTQWTGGTMITMSAREEARLRVLEQVIHGKVSQSQAAGLLAISVRQMRRLQRRYEAQGAAGLAHRLRGQVSNRQLDAGVVLRAQQLITAHYSDFGPTLASEMLARHHGLVLSVESVRTLMTGAGLWHPKRKRAKPIHPMRERRACRGELIQIDGSLHDWFEGRGPRCTLLVFIDDATSELMALRFVQAETTAAYMQTLRDYILRHGLPACLYSDRHSIFCTSNAVNDNPLPTQFARALRSLGIEGIQASSPQAKGRVERANQTLQDRLIKALRLAGINDMASANAWVADYIEQHNRRFAVPARCAQDAHVPYLQASSKLDTILAHHYERRLSNTLSCQFRRQLLQISAPGQQRRLAGQTVQIIEQLDGLLVVSHQQKILAHHVCDRPSYVKGPVDAKTVNLRVQKALTERQRPAQNHPWKRWVGSIPNPRALPRPAS